MSIWVNYVANIEMRAIQRLDYYRGFYWSSSAGRWYPSTQGRQLVGVGEFADKPIITNLRDGSKFVVGEYASWDKLVYVPGATRQ